MKKSVYNEPAMEVIEVITEQGFTMSGVTPDEGQPDGGEVGDDNGGWN